MARRGAFVLTPPSMVVFIISVILAVIAFLVRYAGVAIPVISPARAMDVLAVAYLVLLAAVLFRQL